jgi:hypothetical protein
MDDRRRSAVLLTRRDKRESPDEFPKRTFLLALSGSWYEQKLARVITQGLRKETKGNSNEKRGGGYAMATDTLFICTQLRAGCCSPKG